MRLVKFLLLKGIWEHLNKLYIQFNFFEHFQLEIDTGVTN